MRAYIITTEKENSYNDSIFSELNGKVFHSILDLPKSIFKKSRIQQVEDFVIDVSNGTIDTKNKTIVTVYEHSNPKWS